MPVPGFLAGWGLSPHLTEQPLRDRDAALALFPLWMRESESAVRDAVADAAVVAFNRQASRLAAHAAASSPAFATGARLDFVGQGLGIPRAEGETDAAYRARLLASDERATPAAILAAIDAIVGDETAYYYERPDDDAFVHQKATSTYGTFLGSVPHPVQHPTRVYDDRGRCEPRHLMLWTKTRGTTSTLTLSGSSASTIRIRTRGDDDATAPDNAHGHVVIGLPAYLQPGKSLPSDCALIPTPDAPHIAPSGSLTAAASAAGAFLGSVFTKATAATRAGATSYSGPAVYASTSQPDIVVGKVRAMLAARSMAPVQFTLLFDPEVV